MPTVILYGPPRSSKTVNTQRIADHYGCKEIYDTGKKFNHRLPALLNHSTLYITNETPEIKSRKGLIVIEIKDALKELGL